MEQDNSTNLNDRAQKRFQALKKKFHLDQIASVLPTDRQDQIRNAVTMKDSIDKVIKETEARITYSPDVSDGERWIANEKAQFVENVFKFIETLNLPPQLSLAIGLIISAHKTGNKQDIARAIGALGEYLNG